MSRLRRIELIEPSHQYSYDCPSFFFRETSIFTPRTLAFPSFVDQVEEYEYGLGLGLDLVHRSPSPFELFENVTDLIRIEQRPSISTYRRIQRLQRLGGDVVLQSLSDRVSELESRFDRLLKINGGGGRDRKYTWTAEIKSPSKQGVDRKYQWITEIKEGKKKEEGIRKTYKWTAEIEGKGEEGPISRTYTFKASSGDVGDCSESKKKDKNKKDKHKKKGKEENDMRLVEIEELGDHGAVVLRQAFAKRFGASGSASSAKGKRKELSPQDAALMIQMSFRAYLIRRSKALRALRDLAVAKSKLKEIRALFNNFSYRRRVAHDAEERQRFSEKIIVLLLTVDAIEGADLMVRSAKKSMVDELEAMLDVVDPQPPGPGKSLSIRRRTFDMPDGIIQEEIAAGVAEVVQMLNNQENISNNFGA